MEFRTGGAFDLYLRNLIGKAAVGELCYNNKEWKNRIKKMAIF